MLLSFKPKSILVYILYSRLVNLSYLFKVAGSLSELMTYNAE
jgi:hypothetical protein